MYLMPGKSNQNIKGKVMEKYFDSLNQLMKEEETKGERIAILF